ncbi:MAG: HAD family hydrolase [Oscillospiraceae bacterium]|nr:HAD family hydrolase [Oscillospiraceae bacterium]
MINIKNVKTIIVDLDRTLLHTDKTLSAQTVKVLKACKEKGIQIMVATARPVRTAKQYCEMIDADAMVVSNGARVICGDQQAEYGICQQSAVYLLNVLNRHPSLLITLETGDVAYSNKPIADYETVISDDLVGVVKEEGALKILVRLDSEETLTVVKESLSEDLYCTIANGHLIQIMNKAATKWSGIKAMLEISNCSPEETAYFGDDYDDIEPIKMCGIGVAVSNGIDEVKIAANYVAESNDADGVAKFIEQRILAN